MGNCLSCFKVPPQLSAPPNQTNEIDKQEMPELETLYCSSTSPCLTTNYGDSHHNVIIANSGGIYSNGNTANINKPVIVTNYLSTSSANSSATGGSGGNYYYSGPINSITTISSSTTTTFTAVTQQTSQSLRQFYNIRKASLRSSSAMGQYDSKCTSESKLNTLFDQYKDPNEDNILADGIERLCADLQVNPDEFRVLVLAWKLNAEQMCRFTRSEFINGLKSMRADSIKSIQMRLPELVKDIENNSELFKDLYRFTFRFGLDVASGQRILPSDMAICLWRLVFFNREPAILHKWLTFLERNPHVRGIPRDTWNMFLNFVEAVGDDLSSYDDTEAWPSLFDDFVEYENDQMNQNITKDKDLGDEEMKVIEIDE